jgi:predicted dehydrogenase
LKAAIIGLGKIGMGYDLDLDPKNFILSHAMACKNHDDFDLICGVDASHINRAAFTAKYNKPAYPNVEEGLLSHQIDVVIIATPTGSHLNILKKVLSCQTPRVILCEKPLAYSLEDAREIVDICENSGVILIVNYMRRSDPATLKIKNLIKDGAIKKPISGVVRYTKGFLHNGSHFFNLLEYLFGSSTDFMVISIGRALEGGDFELDVKVNFEDGNFLFISQSDLDNADCSMELIGPSGKINYTKGGESVIWHRKSLETTCNICSSNNPNVETIANNMKKYQESVLNELVNLINGDVYSLCNGRDALKTTESMMKILNTASIEWKN